MATTYCDHGDVSNILRVGTFSGSTTPTDTIVDDLINKNEDFIDKYTNHAWRTTSVTNEHYDYDGSRVLFMNHRKITTFVSETDKLEVRDLVTNGEWTDLVLTANGYEEATTLGQGSKDYWINYEQGLIYFLNVVPLSGISRFRLTYRFGESSVHQDIEKACAYLTAADVFSIIFQPHPALGDENFLPGQDRANQYRQIAMDLIDQHKEPQEISNNQFTSKRMGFPWWYV